MEYMDSNENDLKTNSSPLKRSFDHLDIPFGPQPYRSGGYHAERRALSTSSIPTIRCPRPHTKRRTLSTPTQSSMLVQPASTMSTTYPSFMSVYGNASTNKLYNSVPSPEKLYQNKGSSEDLTRFPSHMNRTHHAPSDPSSKVVNRRSSTNSITSNSTESSPTTTVSTFDSPLLADVPGSPSSSPESASSAAPPKSFKSPPRPIEIHTSASMEQQSRYPLHRMPSSPLPQAATPLISEEARRNVKNLTLDMNVTPLSGPAHSSDFDNSAHPFSAPTSPLKDGLKPGRRKPTNLTIRTPGFSELTFGKIPSLIPPTPGQRLSQPLSSPCLSSLASPTAGPLGGMRLALPTGFVKHGKQESDSSNSGSSIGGNLPSLREEEYQPPKSQEAPERGYTNGPVLIYDSGVYLYLEPTAEEASKFDTVINVAKEIKDPFENAIAQHDTVMSVWRNNAADRRNVPEPQTAMSEKSFKSAFEWPVSTSPSTPTASSGHSTSMTQPKKPEYLHVKWDHNSEILVDLYPLCRLIDDRVATGKKVLIHCQLGVSRSASLIIAYGLFKGFKQDFHSMYMAVKQRSQWVGPNMSLIYQLTEFRSRCARGDYANGGRAPNAHWFVNNAEDSKTPTAEPAQPISQIATLNKQSVMRNTVLPQERPPVRLNKDLPPVPSYSKEERIIRPLQGPPRSSSIQQPVPFQPFVSPTLPKRAASRPLPLRVKSDISRQMNIPPHRPTVLPGITLAQPGSLMDLARQDVPSSPSLFSPRAAEFSATPFGITTAGDLVSSTPKRMRPPPGAFPGGKEWRQSLRQSMDLTGDFSKILAYDPRSPPQVGETKDILRNIDDVL